jgi:cytochrome c-type biogenesis protein CcmH/NrfG
LSEGRSGQLRMQVFVPLLVGVLLGFIVGYFAGGGGRPSVGVLPTGEQAVRETPGDRIRETKKALERDPENPKLWTTLGNTYYDNDDWDRAVEAYEKARRRAPSDPNLLSDLGAAYRNRGEFKRALSFFAKARAADPDHWQSLLNLVLCEAFDVRDAGAAGRHLQELKRRYPEISNLDRVEQQIASLRPTG